MKSHHHPFAWPGLGLALAFAAAPVAAQQMTPVIGGAVDSTPAQLQTDKQHRVAMQQRQMQAYVMNAMAMAGAQRGESPTTAMNATAGGMVTSSRGMTGDVDTSMLTSSSPALKGNLGGGFAMGGGSMGNAGAMPPPPPAAPNPGDAARGNGARMAQQATQAPWDGRMPPGVMLRAQEDPACVDYGR